RRGSVRPARAPADPREGCRRRRRAGPSWLRALRAWRRPPRSRRPGRRRWCRPGREPWSAAPTPGWRGSNLPLRRKPIRWPSSDHLLLLEEFDDLEVGVALVLDLQTRFPLRSRFHRRNRLVETGVDAELSGRQVLHFLLLG